MDRKDTNQGWVGAALPAGVASSLTGVTPASQVRTSNRYSIVEICRLHQRLKSNPTSAIYQMSRSFLSTWKED
jgi:hypothetical protein